MSLAKRAAVMDKKSAERKRIEEFLRSMKDEDEGDKD